MLREAASSLEPFVRSKMLADRMSWNIAKNHIRFGSNVMEFDVGFAARSGRPLAQS